MSSKLSEMEPVGHYALVKIGKYLKISNSRGNVGTPEETKKSLYTAPGEFQKFPTHLTNSK